MVTVGANMVDPVINKTTMGFLDQQPPESFTEKANDCGYVGNIRDVNIYVNVCMYV